MEEYIEILFEGKMYKIKKENIEYILSKLEKLRYDKKDDNENKKYSPQEIINLMKEYGLMDFELLHELEKT